MAALIVSSRPLWTLTAYHFFLLSGLASVGPSVGVTLPVGASAASGAAV
jgi:hypothetical protein